MPDEISWIFWIRFRAFVKTGSEAKNLKQNQNPKFSLEHRTGAETRNLAILTRSDDLTPFNLTVERSAYLPPEFRIRVQIDQIRIWPPRKIRIRTAKKITGSGLDQYSHRHIFFSSSLSISISKTRSESWTLSNAHFSFFNFFHFHIWSQMVQL